MKSKYIFPLLGVLFLFAMVGWGTPNGLQAKEKAVRLHEALGGIIFGFPPLFR